MTNDAYISIKLGDVATIAAGYPLRGSAEALEQGDVSLVQLKNANIDTGIDWSGVARVALPSKRRPLWLNDGDILFAARGTRTLAYALKDVPERAVCGPQFFILRLSKTDVLSSEFVAWQINQKPTQDYLQRNSTGAHIRNIRRNVLEEMPITAPPLKRQLLIVAFWIAATRERAALNQLINLRNAQLDALAADLGQKNKEG